MPGDRLRLVSARASREQVKSLTNVHQIYVLRAAEEPTSRSENRKNTAFGAGAGTKFLCSATPKSDKPPQYGPLTRRFSRNEGCEGPFLSIPPPFPEAA